MDELPLIPDLLREAAAVADSMKQFLAERRSMPADDEKSQAQLLRRRAAEVLGALERAEEWQTAVDSAFRERTGLELQFGATFTEADATRAKELLQMFRQKVGNEYIH